MACYLVLLCRERAVLAILHDRGKAFASFSKAAKTAMLKIDISTLTRLGQTGARLTNNCKETLVVL